MKHIYILSFFRKYSRKFSKQIAIEILLGRNEEYFFEEYYGVLRGEKVSYLVKLLDCMLKNGYLGCSESWKIFLSEKGRKILSSKQEFLDFVS